MAVLFANYRFLIFISVISFISHEAVATPSDNPLFSLVRYCLGIQKSFLGSTISDRDHFSGDQLKAVTGRLRAEKSPLSLLDLAGKAGRSSIRLSLPEDAPHIIHPSRQFPHYGLQIFFLPSPDKPIAIEVQGHHQRHSPFIEISEIKRHAKNSISDEELVIGILGLIKILYDDHGYQLHSQSPMLSGATIKLWILFERLGFAEIQQPNGYPQWKFKEDILKSSALDGFAEIAKRKMNAKAK